MSTEYAVAAYYLGNKDTGDAGTEDSDVTAVTIKIEDLQSDGKFREEGASGKGDLINGFAVDKLGNNSRLTLDDGTVVRGWYIEYKDENDEIQVYFIPTDGTVPQDATLKDDVKVGGSQLGQIKKIETEVPCFTLDAQITTLQGLKAVQTLRPGDHILTRDNGYQPLRWIGSRGLSRTQLVAQRNLRPITIAPHSFGQNMPARPLRLSPNHRVLIEGAAAQLHFGDSEVFAAAKHMVDANSIQISRPDAVTYVHLMFDAHQVVLSDGLWTESFCPTQRAIRGVDPAQQKELRKLFPELFQTDCTIHQPLARMEIKSHEAFLIAP